MTLPIFAQALSSGGGNGRSFLVIFMRSTLHMLSYDRTVSLIVFTISL